MSGNGLSVKPEAATLGIDANSKNAPNQVCAKHKILKMMIKDNKLHISKSS